MWNIPSEMDKYFMYVSPYVQLQISHAKTVETCLEIILIRFDSLMKRIRAMNTCTKTDQHITALFVSLNKN